MELRNLSSSVAHTPSWHLLVSLDAVDLFDEFDYFDCRCLTSLCWRHDLRDLHGLRGHFHSPSPRVARQLRPEAQSLLRAWTLQRPLLVGYRRRWRARLGP